MKPAWEKPTGRKFALVTYKDITARALSCYALIKTECRHKTLKASPLNSRGYERSEHPRI